jgi:hypothetical protein
MVVVDAEPSARTAAASRARPRGWAREACALDQGPCGARNDLVLLLDADTLPRPGLACALTAELSDLILFSAGPRF